MSDNFIATISKKVYYSDSTNWGAWNFTTETELAHSYKVNKGRDNKLFGAKLNGVSDKLEIGLKYKVIANARQKKGSNGKKYWNYEIVSITPLMTSANEQKDFLKVICTPLQVQNITKKYPNFIMDIIEERPIDINKIHGIGEYKFEKIKEKVLGNYWMNEIMRWLSPFGVTRKMIQKLLNNEKNITKLKKKLKENPYELTKVYGLGFSRVDELALKINPEMLLSRYRITAYIQEFLFVEGNTKGNTLVSVERLKRAVKKYFGNDYAKIEDIFNELTKK